MGGHCLFWGGWLGGIRELRGRGGGFRVREGKGGRERAGGYLL